MLIERLNSFPIVSCCFQTLKERRHLLSFPDPADFALYTRASYCYMHIAVERTNVNAHRLSILLGPGDRRNAEGEGWAHSLPPAIHRSQIALRAHHEGRLAHP